MELGMIGLGRMGTNMVRRLQRAGHHCTTIRLVHAGTRDYAIKGSCVPKAFELPCTLINQSLRQHTVHGASGATLGRGVGGPPTAATTRHSNKGLLGSKRVSGILINATAEIKADENMQAKHVLVVGSGERA